MIKLDINILIKVNIDSGRAEMSMVWLLELEIMQLQQSIKPGCHLAMFASKYKFSWTVLDFTLMGPLHGNSDINDTSTLSNLSHLINHSRQTGSSSREFIAAPINLNKYRYSSFSVRSNHHNVGQSSLKHFTMS